MPADYQYLDGLPSVSGILVEVEILRELYAFHGGSMPLLALGSGVKRLAVLWLWVGGWR